MNDATGSAETAPKNTPSEGQSEGARKKIILYGVLAVLGTVVILPLAMLGIYVGHSGSAAKAEGTPAVARVDRRGEGFCWVGFEGGSCLSLNLTVFPEEEAPFAAVVVVNVEDRWLSKVQPGSYVRVVRDREDPNKVYLNTESFPNAAPTPPSTETPTPSR